MNATNQVLHKSESQIRFEVRRLWIDEGRLDGYRKYPLDSFERSISISEAQKIAIEHEMSA